MKLRTAMDFFVPDKFKERAKQFFDSYELETDIGCPESAMNSNLFIPKLKRLCRFCKKSYPFTSFKSEAHIISNLLGNRYLVSDFECHNCNLKFGKYENHLAPFLGISRTLERIKGKEGVPTFKSFDNKIRAENIPFFGLNDAITISRENVLDESIEFDESTGIGRLTYTKQPYKPLMVYKAILKMALSCISSESVEKYPLALKYINSNRLDRVINGICQLHITYLPIGFFDYLPFAAIYKKIDSGSCMPTHMFVLHFKSLIYQIFIPLHTEDVRFANQSIPIHWFPPLCETESEAAETVIWDKVYDLSSNELVRGEKETITYQMSLEDRSKAVGVNLETGEIVSGRPGPAAKLVIVKEGDTIDLSKIHTHI